MTSNETDETVEPTRQQIFKAMRRRAEAYLASGGALLLLWMGIDEIHRTDTSPSWVIFDFVFAGIYLAWLGEAYVRTRRRLRDGPCGSCGGHHD